ncbi:MAG: PmbA/TldA family metallopeptidase, partial [Planctomycetota bacterium]
MNDKQEELVGIALDTTRKAGAEYADVRIVRNRLQRVRTEDTFVAGIEQEEMWGYGIRVLRKGSWGFASSTSPEPEAVREAAGLAAKMAAANADASLAGPVTLSE